MLSSPIRNVPILISLEVSPFCVLFFSFFVSPCSCFLFSFGFLSWLNQVGGLGRSEAEAEADARMYLDKSGKGKAAVQAPTPAQT